MAVKVGRCLWLSMAGNVFRRRDGELMRVIAELDRHHILIEQLAQRDTDIISRLDDVDDGIVDGQFENNLRVGPVKFAEQRLDQRRGCKPWQVQPHEPGGLAAQIADLADRFLHLLHGGPETLQKSGACFGE